jgi:hypothetical protein
MADVDYEWFLNVNRDGCKEKKRIIVYISTELRNLTIRNIDLRRTRGMVLPKSTSGEVDTTLSRIMEVSEA